MSKIRVGVLGATGMVGQNFIRLLYDHPWFDVSHVAASPRSAGKTYAEAVAGRWHMDQEIPENVKQLIVKDASNVEDAKPHCELMFSAVDLDKQAIREFRHSIEIDSNQFVTWDNLGSVYTQQGKFKDAENAFRKALELAPASVPTWFNFGLMKLHTKKFQESVEIFEQCIKLEPRNGEAWKNLAFSFFKTKNYVKAYKTCKKALEHLPNDEELTTLMKSVDRKLK